ERARRGSAGLLHRPGRADQRDQPPRPRRVAARRDLLALALLIMLTALILALPLAQAPQSQPQAPQSQPQAPEPQPQAPETEAWIGGVEAPAQPTGRSTATVLRMPRIPSAPARGVDGSIQVRI